MSVLPCFYYLIISRCSHCKHNDITSLSRRSVFVTVSLVGTRLKADLIGDNVQQEHFVCKLTGKLINKMRYKEVLSISMRDHSYGSHRILLSCGAVYYALFHAIEDTPSQNTEMPLYIRRYHIQASNHAPRVCRIDCVDFCIFYGTI